MATNYKTTWKSTVLQEFINRWFRGRITSAIEEYKAKVTDPTVKNRLVYYRGVMFNPTGEKLASTDLHTVAEDSPLASVLDRQIRIKEDIAEATGVLTYILNYCDSGEDFGYLIHNREGDEHLDEFKKQNQDKFQLIKKWELLRNLL